MEFVFVVPRTELFPSFYPHGLVPFGRELARDELEARIAEHGFFVERAYAERTPTLKQVIPYTVVTRGDELLLLRRLGAGGEARLRNKLSIGVGGHVNPEDAEASAPDGGERPTPVAAGARRELDEELVISTRSRLRAVGILNDDSNPVGAVHVGIVGVQEVEGEVRIRERDVLEGEFVPRSELVSLHERGANLETWSAKLIERLDEVLPSPAPALS